MAKRVLNGTQIKAKKCTSRAKSFRVGEIVIIHNESPRNKCKLCKVIKLIPSDDGLVRSAVVWTQKTELNRPVTKLYPLELKEQNIAKPKNANLGTNEEAMLNDDSSKHQISEMEDVIELDYNEMYEEEEVGRTGPRHDPNGGESHQGHGDGQRHGTQRQRSNGGESHRDDAFEQRQRNKSSYNRAAQQAERQLRPPARYEQRRATRRTQQSRSKDDNRVTPPKGQPRGNECEPSPQDLWWRFSDATTAVNVWNNH
ncbi:hypothetical protein niasHT_023706 [Heterodera trifolii]|uniref:DUF5641 domain-containing protein n=1 Tax=Heterodera trifolii TaxID=157864 RepID=A0ABD2JAE8_9BILA